jgi:hypothetical protein
MFVLLLGVASGCSDDSTGANGSGGGSGAGTGGSGGSAGTGGAGGTAGSSDAGPSKPTPEQTADCQKFQGAICGKFVECDERLAAGFGSAAKCAEIRTPFCANYLYADGVAWDMAKSDACVAAVKALDCTRFRRWALQGSIELAECAPPSGNLATGATCVNPAQCQSGACSISITTGCGACVVPQAADGPCNTTADCQLGLACVSETAQCKPFGALGAACGIAMPPCFVELTCIGGKCAAPLAEGATCNRNTIECDLSKALICNQNDSTCKKMALGGTTCGFSSTDGTLHGCNLDNYCDSPTVMDGTCRPRVGAGAPCTLDQRGADFLGHNCAPGLQCLSGTCRAPDRHHCGP